MKKLSIEDKELLLKDLCWRLPYDVKGKVYAEVSDGKYDITGDMIFYDAPFDVILDEINVSTEEIHVVAIGNEDTVEFIEIQQTDCNPYTIDDFKPYLRPMSSMTKEEYNEMQMVLGRGEYAALMNKTSGLELWLESVDTDPTIWFNSLVDVQDWLNAHHFDYRGLIEKGLALTAPEGMYK